jgi:sec-independent protein translocase protein TatC
VNGNDSRTAGEDAPRPFADHLADLRRCLIRCALAWLVATLVMIPLAPGVLSALVEPLRRAGEDPAALIRGMRLGSGFSILFKVMIWGGVVLSLPLLLAFVAQFVFPGLHRRERRLVMAALVAAGVLFAGGVALGYGPTMPVALQAMMAVNRWMGVEIGPLLLEDYVSFVLQLLLAFGVAFELPLLLVALGWMGVLPARVLRARRRHAIVAIFVIAMLLTPPDAVSQIAMAVPMCVLYEGCILLVAARERARAAHAVEREAT